MNATKTVVKASPRRTWPESAALTPGPGPGRELSAWLAGWREAGTGPELGLLAHCCGHRANLIAKNCIRQVCRDHYRAASIPVTAGEAGSGSSGSNTFLGRGSAADIGVQLGLEERGQGL